MSAWNDYIDDGNSSSVQIPIPINHHSDPNREYKDITTPEEKDWLYYDKNGRICIRHVPHTEERNFWNVNPTAKEKLYVNPKVAVNKSQEDLIKEIPFDVISKYEKLYGKLTNMSLLDPVSNLKWDNMRFIDSKAFTPAANAFLKSKRSAKGTAETPKYTHYLKGTRNYDIFWEEEFRRWKFGYEPIVDGKPCGLRISGEFYFYLNYSMMTLGRQEEDGSITNMETFPNFMAMDYYWFRELEAREFPHYYGLDDTYKKSISCTKTRRAGFSYKEAAGCCWIILTERKARVAIVSAPDSEKPDATVAAKKCIPILDHVSNYTPFGIPKMADPKRNGGWVNESSRITNEFVEIILGYVNTRTKERTGRQSSIVTITLSKDDAAAGEGLRRVYFEEAGKIGNLAKAWTFTLQSLKMGAQLRGIGVIFGTGGSMVSNTGKEGKSRAFSTLHYNPDASEIASFDNIYEYKLVPGAKSGYFVTSLWCHFGAYVKMDGIKYEAVDDQGNSHFWVAELALNKERRQKMPPNDTIRNYNDYLTQKPITASEAFLITQGSIFQSADLIARQNAVRTSPGGFDALRQAGELVMVNGKVEFKPDLSRKLQPIVTMNEDFSNKEGCLLMYEKPQFINGKVPDDAFIITVDPIGQDTQGKSFSSIHVLKSPYYQELFGPKTIVASYFGRHYERPLANLHDLLYKLSIYYNAKISYETDNSGGQILPYFTTKKALDRLLSTPDRTMAASLLAGASKTSSRKYGHTMGHDKHKSTGERLLYEWLGQEVVISGEMVDADGQVIEAKRVRNIDLLDDELLIEQLIVYSRVGNFDAVLSLMGGMVQMKEIFSFDADVKEDDSSDISSQLLDYYNKKLNRSNSNPRNNHVPQTSSSDGASRTYYGSGSNNSNPNKFAKQKGASHWLSAFMDEDELI